MDATPLRLISGLLLFACVVSQYSEPPKNAHNYYGKYIGELEVFAHGINGTVFAVDDSTIFVKSFWYDGTGPDAYFWVGNTSAPNPQGYIVPYPETEKGSEPRVLQAYNDTDVILKLPDRIQIKDIKWLSVWCRRFTVDFAHVFIPSKLVMPKVRTLTEFSRFAHGLRSEPITILDSRTFYIPNLHYDGAGPDAYFWVGTGPEPTVYGHKVPNERGSLAPLRGYQGEDIEIVLPKNMTVYDINWLSVWCVEYRQNFGHIIIPPDLDVPPAVGQTKITTSSTPRPPTAKYELTNCKEMLQGRVQVQWEKIGEDVQIRVSGRIEEDQYVAFGLSGAQGKAQMLDGDVVVIAYDTKTGKFIAEDYYMSSYSQCDNEKGVCPDKRVGGRNDATLIHGERKHGVTSVTYMRPMRTNEPGKQDRVIPNTETSVIAAIGPLNSRLEANSHNREDKTTEDIRIDFTSRNVHECVNSLYNLPNTPELKPWPPAVITNETTFSARIGPTGGKRGYTQITGQPSWGIAWYINDLLIPELTVKRGQTYTFIVEGGKDPTNPAKYHPFYITDSREGGFGQKTNEQQKAEKVFAGVKYDSENYPYPTGTGRYCEWINKGIEMSASSETFESFFETLRLECKEGQPGTLVWTVPNDAPNTLYYQCYAHKNLGWIIHVENGASITSPALSLLAASVIWLLTYSR